MFFGVAWVALALSGCSAPRLDCTTIEGKAAILDKTYIDLNNGDCASAIADVDGLYDSACTDNQTRLARAAAHACASGIPSFFGFLGSLATGSFASVPGQGSSIFRTIAKLFYSSSGNLLGQQVQSSWDSTDALLATLNPGAIIAVANQVNNTTFNPGSVSPADRVDDSNIYTILVSMATLGSLEDQYSAPNTSTWAKGQKLGQTVVRPTGWEVAANIDEEGCSYASALLNMIDSAGAVNGGSSSFKSVLADITILKTVFDAACDAGCVGNPATPSGCNIPAGCGGCPTSLRYRTGCQPTKANDPASCAAAGLLYYIDTNTTYGWFGP